MSISLGLCEQCGSKGVSRRAAHGSMKEGISGKKWIDRPEEKTDMEARAAEKSSERMVFDQ